MVLGTRPNRDMDLDPTMQANSYGDDSENAEYHPDEAHMLAKVISETITSLFRTADLVRSPVSKKEFIQAHQAPRTQVPDAGDIRLVRQKYPKLGPGWLLERLGIAITNRRHLIKYLLAHKSQRQAEGIGSIDDTGSATTSGFPFGKTTKSVGPKGSPASHGSGPGGAGGVALSPATGSTPSSAFPYPQLARLSPSGEPFECPACFTTQSFTSEESWRYV